MTETENFTILVADDDASIRLVLGEAFADEGWRVITAEDTPSLKEMVASGAGDLLLTDVLMPSGNGLDLLENIRQERPELPIIVMSAQNTLATAVRASKEGAFEYLPKPFDLDHMVAVVKKALEKTQKKDASQTRVKDAEDTVQLIGTSDSMQALYRTIARVVTTNLTVLISGESGTGKELVAKALHYHGDRKAMPFVAVNMAAIPKDLIESELFGHEKGAFTGAASSVEGRFGQAKGGTLFLDEIGDMPFDAQTRLLRVLQEGEYRPVGGRTLIKADVRIIAATHQNLSDLVQKKLFRQDLYYRINVVPLKVPPLRDRLEDVPALVQHLIDIAVKDGLPRKAISSTAMDALLAYKWPGNVRELENLLRRIMVLYSEQQITAQIIQQEIARNMPQSGGDGSDKINLGESLQAAVKHHLDTYFEQHDDKLPPNGLYHRILRELEKPLIEKVMESTNANQLRAAEVLGLNRNTLRKKIKELDISTHKKTDD